MEDLISQEKQFELKNMISEAINKRKTERGRKKAITLRLTEHDLQKARNNAAKLGLPYQTYLTSLVHQGLNKE